MKYHLLTLSFVLAALATPHGARGEAQVKITNQHSAAGAPPESNTPTGATAGQFRSLAATSGGRNTAASAGSTTPVAVPTNGTLKLWNSMAGPSFALGVPDYAFGERIMPPLDVQPLAYWRPAPAAPGEIVQVSGQPVNYTPIPAGTQLRYYYSQHSRVVYASESGSVEVTWRSALADGSGNFTVLKRTYIVSIVPAVRPYRMFWTGAPQFGPIVTLPAGVENAFIAYTDRFPAAIGTSPIGPNGQPNPENRTFWLDTATQQKHFRAERVEGRIFLELLGAELDPATGRREALGVRVVDVFTEPVPNATAFTETTFLGDQLEPSETGAPDAVVRGALLPDVRAGLSASPPLIANHPLNEQAAYFAERATGNPDEVVIMWKERDDRGIQWPFMRNSYNLAWPSDSESYALNALAGGSAPASIDLFNTNTPTLVYQDTAGEASLSQGRFSVVPGGDGTNRSLILFQANGRFWYQRVFSADSDLFGTDGSGDPLIAGQPSAVTVSFAATVNVGERIEAPDLAATGRPGDDDKPLSRAGSILTSQGTAYHLGAYLDPLGPAGFPTAELRSEIIPVNALAGNNHLTVWWYRKVRGPSADFQPVHWPSVVATYTLQWPAVAPATPANRGTELVIARNDGTGELSPAQSLGFIYFQNDPEAHGYNPNDEHAMMIAGRAYALRDDLNLPTSSDPRVLLSYTHPEDNRPAMRVFKVMRERILDATDPTNPDKNLLFNYPATAGKILQSPAPLPIMPLPLENGVNKNREVPGVPDPDVGDATPAYYDKFLWEDRKHSQWVYRGPHGATTPAFKMEYWYVTQPGFAYPGNPTPPPVGSIQPFLRASNGAGGYLTSPQQVTFRPLWPNAPDLEFGQTLAGSVAGLPNVRNNSSLEVLYEQSKAGDTNGARTSVLLFDPTRAKTYPMKTLAGGQQLDKLPGSLATDSRNGKTYFQKLPPHLKERFFFNPNIGVDGAIVLEGRFVDEIVGEDYQLLNVLSGPDLAAIQGLVPSADLNKTAWDAVVQNLVTTVQTSEEDPNSPGYYRAGPPTGASQDYFSGALPEVTNDDQPVDSYAMTTAGTGQGYVVLVAGNGLAPRTPEAEPIALHVIRVAAPLHTGQVKVLASANPLDEKVTLRHSSDFAGRPQDYDFEWSYSPPINGREPSTEPPPGQPGTAWFSLPRGLINTHVVEGASILTITDNYWMMRYCPKVASHPQLNVWSEWTQPALVEGWIKRALAGINPFSQRVTDFFNNSINTDVSILTQAGTRWEGNIALNLANINEFGLIEIYETILNRGMDLSINGIPPLDYGPANDALLLASGYLADLYSILGEEAAADAANPTIAFDAQSIGSVADSSIAADFTSVFNQTSTSRFAFQGQVRNLLEEELGLLLGRDDVNSPGVELSPSYNRLYWNYTRGINAGEVIYALNYNIRERQEDSSDGKIDAADAYRMFPQGHGDAYGHYLTAVTNYYRLLTHQQFTWGPRIEAVNVLGVPVQVDYLDERKFSSASARVAATARQITGLIHRQSFTADKSQGWHHLRDGSDPVQNFRDGKKTSDKRTRHWGLDEWAARGSQGAYFNWVVANAILPATSTATGIEKIDRTTVPELDEIALAADQLQQAADNANAWLNPLGLSADSTLFDISPAELTAGKTHFEQIYERATRALGNAFDTFDQATASTRLLRSLENQADDLSTAVYDQERAFNLQLIDIFGTPYEGDKGPGKAYVQGYDGPDLFRWFYIGQVTQFSDPFDVSGDSDVAGGTGGDGTVTYELNVDAYDARQFLPENPDEAAGVPRPEHAATISYVIRPDSPVQYATPEMGRRVHPGRLQLALQDLNAKREDMAAILDFYNRNGAIFETQLRIFNESIDAYSKRQEISEKTRDAITGLQTVIAAFHTASRIAETLGVLAQATSDALTDAVPAVSGWDTMDVTFPIRGGFKTVYVAAITLASAVVTASESAADFTEIGVSFEENDLERKLEEAGFPAEYLRMAADVQMAWYDWLALGSNIDQAALALQKSRMELAALIDEGEAIKRSREIFRKRAAAITQGYRTRDVAFRTFRTEALEQYQTLLDWATRYACLAAKAYDYETGLLGTPQGQSFISDIVGSRALGLRNAAGQPIFAASSTGDPGLSGLLAKLNGDWSSVRTRLGFNNPDIFGTVFSLRQELYRIPGDTAPIDTDDDANNDSQQDKTWKEQMQSLIVSDLRNDADVATHCLQLSGTTTPVPGFIIPFGTTVEDGLNFFGKPLAGGDSTFTSTSFATKIHSAGVSFDGYVGMNAYAPGAPVATGPSTGAPNSLSATPYVFLIPTGQDIMRTPPLGDTSVIRSYNVQDYALPLPFNIGASEFSNVQFWTGNDTLTENFLTPRKHQAFRAVDSPVYFYLPMSSDFTNRRLVGRSVWNTGWKLVIPANTLLNSTSEGLSRFLKSVRDIKLYVRSYSYSGN